MESSKKIKVKFKSPSGTVVSGMVGSDMPKAAKLKEDARKLRSENLKKETLKKRCSRIKS
jgi:hypothetical protein